VIAETLSVLYEELPIILFVLALGILGVALLLREIYGKK